MKKKKYPSLIAFCGLAGSGKTTAADFLHDNFGFIHYSFADPIRDMLAQLGVTRDQTKGERKTKPLSWLGDKTPRELLQTLGTEWGRDKVCSDIWLNVATRRLDSIKLHSVVIDDCRFDNEARWVQERGGIVVSITRPGLTVMKHRSEAGVSPKYINHTISNDSTAGLFVSAIESLLSA